jgi:glycosyltransferase involved in cell wall biosynthesis
LDLYHTDARHGAVLFLLNRLNIGGSEKKTVNLVNELRRRGCNAHLAYLNTPDDLLGRVSDTVPVFGLNRKGKLSIAAIAALRDYIVQNDVAKVICVNLYPLLYAQAASAFITRARRPSIMVAVNSTKFVNTKEKLQMVLYRPLLGRAQKLIFGCRAQQEMWAGMYGLEESKCAVIYNGIDVTYFTSDATEIDTKNMVDVASMQNRKLMVGTVGQLRPVKNQVELIEVLERLRKTIGNVGVVIAGDGPERGNITAAAIESGCIDRVSILGQVSDVRPVLEKIDVFVLPSLSETFSNAALEAMAMGKVVILSDTGGAREMVQDGETGYIYKQGDIEYLASIIEKLAREPLLKMRIGDCARKSVLDRFTFEKMVQDYHQLLLETDAPAAHLH